MRVYTTREALRVIDEVGEKQPHLAIHGADYFKNHPDHELLLDRARYWDAQKWSHPLFVGAACERLANAIADVAFELEMAKTTRWFHPGYSGPFNFLRPPAYDVGSGFFEAERLEYRWSSIP